MPMPIARRHCYTSDKVSMSPTYRVCTNTLATAGENTCWMQQWRALRKQGIATPDPWHQFMKDFEYFLEKRLNKNEEIVLGIDVNEATLPAAEIQQCAR
eukprot:12003074-Ditylum_brightwellii.AAC.1